MSRFLAGNLRIFGSASPAGGFTGSAKDFIAAGDSVLQRIKHHMNEGLHLSETWDVRFWIFLSHGNPNNSTGIWGSN